MLTSLLATPLAQDSVVVKSPLPGGIAVVVRFIFGVPQWVMITGIVLGVIVAVLVLRFLWLRRRAIIAWLTSRDRPTKLALAAAVAALVLAAAGIGTYSWNYIQHDNGFCTGCHVMESPFIKMQAAGRNTALQPHAKLACHACHQQSIFASMWQLYVWIAERPSEIKKHAEVPRQVCEGCHVTGSQRETWKDVSTTAGHRVHLTSDSASLRDVQCVKCHGQEVHRFIPSSKTCGQSGCHENLRIELGKMRTQTALHCAVCHQFTERVPRLAVRDSATKVLLPGVPQCLSCHEMRAILAEFDPAQDPHGGKCSTCHDPHNQVRASDAKARCAECHDKWRANAFHAGVAHRKVVQTHDCVLCHEPHRSRADASDCVGCHKAVRGKGGELRPPVPFDTSEALRRTSARSGRSIHPPLHWHPTGLASTARISRPQP